MTLVGSCRDSGWALCCASSLSNCYIPLSCIAVHGRLARCSDSIGLGLCVWVCFVCAGVWQPSRFEDHLEIWRIPQGTLTKRSCTNVHEAAQAEKQKAGTREEHILLCCLCIYWQAHAGMPFEIQSFLLQGIWKNGVPYNTFPQRAGGGKTLIWGFTWCVSNILQLFSRKVFFFSPIFIKHHNHHLFQHRT